MKYAFSQFILNTETKELYAGDTNIVITKLHYDLLLLFVKNPAKVFSKNELIDEVWNGRYVTENSIDQSVSKLRKLLNSVKNQTYIKTAYGKGFMFIPEVTLVTQQEPDALKRTKITRLIPIAIITIMTIGIALLVFGLNNAKKNNPQNSLLLIVSATNENNWLDQSSMTFINQVFGFTNAANLKDIKKKPEYLNRKKYIENQWEISPGLKVVTTTVSQKDNLFSIKIDIANKLQQLQTQSFTDVSLATVIKSASRWLAKKVGHEDSFTKIDFLIPEDSYIVELYMRGLASIGKGEFDKAEHFFQLCIEEKSDFHLARLELAKVKVKQGKLEKSLAILNTLSKTIVFPQIEIEINKTRADIYDMQGKLKEAIELYVSILNKYKSESISQLNEVRYSLSFSYTSNMEYDKALTELNTLESNLIEQENSELLAHVLQKKASILQNLGHTNLAQKSAEKALDLFFKLEDIIGEAKIYSTLARITTHQAKYKLSIKYLEQALHINRSLKYKLGTGASLNELIYVLMVRGEFSKAWQLNREMQNIAIDIDYNAMLQISKQYSIDITRAQKKWKQSELYLQEHLQLAQASRNKRALLKNKLLTLDFLIDKGETENVEQLIAAIQTHINDSQEIRLQPRINKHLARHYLNNNEGDKAIILLLQTKNLAKETEDAETIIEINNLLAQYYIDSEQVQKASVVLNESMDFNPLPYPFLLLKSKVNYALGKLLKALDYANECKAISNEFWTLEDERYLQQLAGDSNI